MMVSGGECVFEITKTNNTRKGRVGGEDGYCHGGVGGRYANIDFDLGFFDQICISYLVERC